MWKYVKRYLPFAVLAALFMVGEVTMDLLQPTIMSNIVDDGVLGLNNGGVGDMHLILTLGLRMIILVIIGGCCGSLNNVFSHITAQNVGNEIRKDAFKNIMRFSFPQRDGFGTGSLVTRVTNDITQIQNFVSTFVRGIVRNSFLVIGSIFFMSRLDIHFGIIVLCALPFMLACLIICLKKGTPFFSVLQEQLDGVNGIMQEDVSGIRIIKACVREVYEKARFGKANGDLIRTQLKVLVIFAFMNPVVNAIMYVAVAVILRVGAVDVSNGFTTPGNVMAALTYTTQMLQGVMMMVMIFQNISRGWVSWKRVRVILQTEPEMKDGAGYEETIRARGKSGERDDVTENTAEYAGEQNGRSVSGGDIEFRDVSFAYPGRAQMVLEHINLHIRAGETIGIMGATGCGKTTLVSLIPRFYEVSEGAVLVDGVDVRDYRQKELRDRITIALQKSELFSVSMGENISWGRPEAAAEDIRLAADIAQAREFIDSTPEGYDTMVAERGMSLSGGQKQRMSIARAVLKSSEIMIFDDSTSALDLRTEANLYNALKQSCPDSTKIIIAQRIASVRNADRIVVLENGRVSACGTHSELMKICPAYQDIYQSQLGEDADEFVSVSEGFGSLSSGKGVMA